jgi:hypothetical protein
LERPLLPARTVAPTVNRTLPVALLLAVAGGCSFPELHYETAATDASWIPDGPSGSSSGFVSSNDASETPDAQHDAVSEVAEVAEGGEAGEAGDPCDRDGDGYADTKCLGTDCCDTDSRAHPFQASYYTAPDACGSFDYDCSGANEPQYGAYLSCAGPATACHSLCQSSPCSCGDILGACSYGFTGPAPQCGQTGSWGLCVPNGNGCIPSTTVESMAQPCH